MPLDPMVKAFLDQAQAMPRPKVWEAPLSVVRNSFAGMMGLVGAQNVPVGRIENFTIPTPAGGIRARSYAPVASGGEALPTLVYFHGGGFVVGDLDTHDGICRLLVAEGGFRWLSANKREGAFSPWPATATSPANVLRTCRGGGPEVASPWAVPKPDECVMVLALAP